MSFQAVLSLTALFLPYLVGAHVRMAEPRPYGDNGWDFQNPLNASEFPCRQTYDPTSPTTSIKVGDTQKLLFVPVDTATHGGGSCQLSISTNMKPASSADFKVFKSFIGECPARFSADPHYSATRTDMTFEIPAAIPNGKAIFAWTWTAMKTNEFFMACAPVEISGGSDNSDEFNELPHIVVPNLVKDSAGQPTGCSHNTNGNFIPQYREPGPDKVEELTQFAIDRGTKLALLPEVCDEVFTGTAETTVAPKPSSVPCVVATTPGMQCSPDGMYWGYCQASVIEYQESPPGQKCVDGAFIVVTKRDMPSAADSTLAPPRKRTIGNTVKCNGDGKILCNGPDEFARCQDQQGTIEAVDPGTVCEKSELVQQELRRRTTGQPAAPVLGRRSAGARSALPEDKKRTVGTTVRCGKEGKILCNGPNEFGECQTNAQGALEATIEAVDQGERCDPKLGLVKA